MVRGYRTFGEFLHSGEGIATNVLTDRLRRLAEAGMVQAEKAEDDARRVYYRLTDKGIAFAPVLLELLIWAARYEDTAAPCAVINHIQANRAAVLAETHRRWKDRDPTPILPPFAAQGPRSKTTEETTT